MYPEYLAHYGIKGMKWGKRKKRYIVNGQSKTKINEQDVIDRLSGRRTSYVLGGKYGTDDHLSPITRTWHARTFTGDVQQRAARIKLMERATRQAEKWLKKRKRQKIKEEKANKKAQRVVDNFIKKLSRKNK